MLLKKRTFVSLLLLFVCLAVVFFACTNDNEEEYFKENLTAGSCDTLDISFQEDIFPVFESQCISCHNAASPAGGINLENYDAIKPLAETPLLSGVIKHEDGFSPMPQGADKLPECTINKFDAWVNQGLKNN